MKNLLIILLLTLISTQSYSYLSVSDEIDSMISGFDECDDSENLEIFHKMYSELQTSDKNNEDHPFYVDVSRYNISFESDKNSCEVYVDPYDWRCYTAICE